MDAGTYNRTWDIVDIGSYLRVAKSKKQLYLLFWDILEHDSDTALKLAKEQKQHREELEQKLAIFEAAYLDLRSFLKKITRNSEKF